MNTEAIKSNWRRILPTMTERAKRNVNGEASYVCPLCGHGKGGDGLTFTPGTNQLKCFGCGFSGDIIDLWGQVHNQDFKAAADTLQALFGLSDAAPVMPVRKATAAEAFSFIGYMQECNARLSDPAAVEYLNSRGLSLETCKRLGLGYDPKADPAEKGHQTPRIIAPTDDNGLITRAIVENKYPKLNTLNKYGGVGIFNAGALDKDYCFIVEGWTDAASLEEIGHPAAALNSVSNKALLLNRPIRARLILALDNDRDGQKVQEELDAALNVPHINAQLPQGIKDANDFLLSDRGIFKKWADAAAAAALALNDTGDSVSGYILSGGFKKDIELFKFSSRHRTGFSSIDQKLGGLYPGLHVVAGISSLGKTTFCHQIADHLAQNHTDVIYFTLEQSRAELVCKSLSRMIGTQNPVSSYAIRNGSADATQMLKTYADRIQDRLHIVEGQINGCTLGHITDKIRAHMTQTGRLPVVVIDYLQLIQLDKDRRINTDKQRVDEVVTGLKQFARDLNIAVVAISSMNRGNYGQEADFSALKESGAIEYSADTVLFLQLSALSGAAYKKAKTEDEKRLVLRNAKEAVPREIDVVCLKNRAGLTGWQAPMQYYPNADTFIDCLASPAAGGIDWTTAPKA